MGRMTQRIATLTDFLHPVTAEAFFAEYYDRKPLHVPASSPEKFADVMTWDILTALLNMTAIWSPRNLQLVLDKEMVPAEQYCRQAIDRNLQPTLQPDAGLVKGWLRRGASIVANDIDTLTPGLAAAANALEAATGGKVQSNLYCSWKQRQAFSTHFDTHDVYALHVAGEKVWRVYEGRLDNPIANEAFKTLDDDYHRTHRGAVALEVELRPGDLLYIPRGQYHDALASSEGCIHLAYGVTRVIGVDVLGLIYERAVADPLFRANMPRAEAGPDARRQWLDGLAARLADIGRDAASLAALETIAAGFRYPRGGFDLPGDAQLDFERTVFEVMPKSLEIVRDNGRTLLKSARGVVPVPDAVAGPVAWIVRQRRFSGSDLTSAFPAVAGEARAKLLRDLSAMHVIGPT
jgi:ribosomal protein L16 Arg81 hydroxylase